MTVITEPPEQTNKNNKQPREQATIQTLENIEDLPENLRASIQSF